MTTHGKNTNAGDEPHYLMVAESVWSDGDLDLSNNFADGDARWFAAESLEAGPHARPNRFGSLWSVHDIGVPVAILPVYVAATRLAAHVPEGWLARFRQTQGHLAYALIGLALTALSALAITLMTSGLGRRAGPRAAAIVALACGLSPPVLSMSFLIFPETIALAIVCAVVWLAFLRDEETTFARMIGVAIAIGVMPWLHRKFALVALGLLVVLIYERRVWFTTAGTGQRLLVAAAALVPHAAFHAWTVVYWGNLGGPQLLGGLPFSWTSLPRGALGLLFDRSRGLIGGAPIYLLAPAAWLIAWRRTWPWLLPIALLYLPMAAYVDWPSGWAPAARYLAPILPLVALPAAFALQSRAFRAIAWPILAWQLVLTAVAWQYPRGFWPTDDTSNGLLERVPLVGPVVDRWLPSIASGDPLGPAWIWAGLAVGAALIVVTLKSTSGVVLRRT